MRLVFVWLALAGCDRVFGLDEPFPITADAAIDAPGCSNHLFSSPVELAGTFQDVVPTWDPTFATPLQLWFVRARMTGEVDIWCATRASEQDPFGDALPVMGLDTGDDSNPSFSADGRDLLFVRGARVYETTRLSETDSFGPPVLAAGLSTVEVRNGIDLSLDGLTLYYAEGNGDLYSVTRPTRDLPFGARSVNLASNVSWLTVSPDQLELYYDSLSDNEYIIHRMVRANPAAPFDSDRPVMAGTDPDISSDSRSLLMSDGRAIKIGYRTCM